MAVMLNTSSSVKCGRAKTSNNRFELTSGSLRFPSAAQPERWARREPDVRNRG